MADPCSRIVSVIISLILILTFSGCAGKDVAKPMDEAIGYVGSTGFDAYVEGNLEGEAQKTITNSIGIEFVLIQAGEFEMGSPAGDEGPVHTVTIEKAYYLGKFEVTQKQWREVMGSNPSYHEGDNLPVEKVSWNDVQEFVRKLNKIEGTDKYRLPSEAEWEYAARASTTTRYSFGDNVSDLGDYALYVSNPGTYYPAAQMQPNPWCMYGMHGIVWEWVQDRWHSDYDGAPTDGSAWEDGSSSHRILRGGGEFGIPSLCRSADRRRSDPDNRVSNLGFRLLQEL